MAAMAGVSGVLSAPRLVNIGGRSEPWKPMAMIPSKPMRMWRRLVVAKAAPDGLSEKVAESIKEAETACSENPASGECVAAWDEVEELSAAASHARDRQKSTDPLEEYCKDNPEVEECRTYED